MSHRDTAAPQDASAPLDASTGMVRAVSRWQIVGLSINDVIGSGIYLLPASTALLLGPASLWAVLLAGIAVGLLVLCYAQAGSYYDDAGGSYLYARDAFGDFIGFEVGWMTWLTRVASAAALSSGLALAVSKFWAPAGEGWGWTAVVVGSMAFLTFINVVGVRTAARTGVVLVLAKLVPLLFFIAVGAFFVDWSQAIAMGAPPTDKLGEGALLLLYAYAGFENTPAAAGEFRNPRRDVPFALITMIVLVTLIYVAVQVVAQGTVPDLAASKSPLADAAEVFAGPAGAFLLTIGAAVSILGSNSNTMLFGPRYLYALAADGYGPAALSRVHPRFHTPTVAIIVTSLLSLALVLGQQYGGSGVSEAFANLALLSVVARLCSYIGTSASVLVLRKRYSDRPNALSLPGGPIIPLLALLLSVALMASAGAHNLVAAAVAIAVGAVVYLMRRKPA